MACRARLIDGMSTSDSATCIVDYVHAIGCRELKAALLSIIWPRILDPRMHAVHARHCPRDARSSALLLRASVHACHCMCIIACPDLRGARGEIKDKSGADRQHVDLRVSMRLCTVACACMAHSLYYAITCSRIPCRAVLHGNACS
jgi:hypothetical protein